MANKIQNGYKVPISPGTYYVTWGEGENDELPTKVVVTECDDGELRLDAYHYGNNTWEGFVQRAPCTGDNILDYLRILRDDEQFAPASNGYYVSFANDPDGERGTGGYDPETGKGPRPIELVKWVAPT